MDDLPTPTPRELEMLKVLWDRGPSSVRDVLRALQGREPDLAYTTVQTLLRIMADKGLVRHEAVGRTFIYTAHFTRDDSAARYLDRVFDGAAGDLVSSLLQSESISPAELERIHALIAAARRRAEKH